MSALILLGSAALIVVNLGLNRYEDNMELQKAEKSRPALYVTVIAELPASPMPTPTPVIVKKYRFNFSVPKGLTVSYSGEVLSGKENDENQGVLTYSIETEEEKIETLLTDAYGHSIEYCPGDRVELYTYTISVPDSFKVASSMFSPEEYQEKLTYSDKVIDKYKFYYEYTAVAGEEDYRERSNELPYMSRYVFSNALTEPELEITDNLGDQLPCTFINYGFEVTEPFSSDIIPDEIAESFDVIFAAEQVSLLTSNDLGTRYFFTLTDGTEQEYIPGTSYSTIFKKTKVVNGERVFRFDRPKDYGKSILAPLLVQDGLADKLISQWLKQSDKKLTSDHVMPTFTNESVSNVTVFSENLFSCDIEFTKTFYLISSNTKKVSTPKMTFLFRRNPDHTGTSDTYPWQILGYTDIIEDEGIEEND